MTVDPLSEDAPPPPPPSGPAPRPAGARRAAYAGSRERVELQVAVAAAAAGDRRALERVLRTVQPQVVQYCRARLGGRALGATGPEDVAQDVLLAVCQALPRYRAAAGGAFMAFVLAIARNKLMDAYRTAARDRSEPMSAVPESARTEDDPELLAVAAEDHRLLDGLLGRLSANHREVLVLRVVVGLSAAETAEVMASTPGAVRVAQHRALTRLRRLAASG